MMAESKVNYVGEREVFFELNGQLRAIFVKDKAAAKVLVSHPKALDNVKGSIGAPMPGEILEIKVKEGDVVGVKSRPLE